MSLPARMTSIGFLLLYILSATQVAEAVNCMACQGTPGSPCDESPHLIAQVVPCNGTCLTRRTLFSTGRELRTIWRGCDTTIFPLILPEDHRDTCIDGNFFVECTATCRGELCNKLNNGIPWCWDCKGMEQPCNAKSKSGAFDCPLEEATTTTKPVTFNECIGCDGEAGTDCDARAFTVGNQIRCKGACITRRTLDKKTRKLKTVWRGCMSSLFPGTLRLDALNGCDESGSTNVECTQTCEGMRLCNRYSTGFGSCWTEEGRLKLQCDNNRNPAPESDIEIPSTTQPSKAKATTKSRATTAKKGKADASDEEPEVKAKATTGKTTNGTRSKTLATRKKYHDSSSSIAGLSFIFILCCFSFSFLMRF